MQQKHFRIFGKQKLFLIVNKTASGIQKMYHSNLENFYAIWYYVTFPQVSSKDVYMKNMQILYLLYPFVSWVYQVAQLNSSYLSKPLSTRYCFATCPKIVAVQKAFNYFCIRMYNIRTTFIWQQKHALMKSVLDNFDGIELWHINLDGIYVFLCAIFALQDLIEELRYNHLNFSIGYEKPY